ncbi:hypothetical protein [Ornithinimicrobium avium]|nr:hypothetical protein [Ornithinimicrobium avium]
MRVLPVAGQPEIELGDEQEREVVGRLVQEEHVRRVGEDDGER